MVWTQADTIALAQQNCTYCCGLGMCPGLNGSARPCKCVFRAIFRACYRKFQQCAKEELRSSSRISMEATLRTHKLGQPYPKQMYSLKNEEYMADFTLVGKRTLNPYPDCPETRRYILFKNHYLLGADWKLCAKRVPYDRGTMFHELYRVEEILGQAFRELTPHPLFPIDEYFSPTMKGRNGGPPLIVGVAK